jgi:hypothetical protein
LEERAKRRREWWKKAICKPKRGVRFTLRMQRIFEFTRAGGKVALRITGEVFTPYERLVSRAAFVRNIEWASGWRRVVR